MQITGYGYHHKHGYSAKKASDKGQKRAFRPLRRKSNSPFQELKSDAQTNLRMLHGILFFYVVVANFTASKNEFKISSAQNVPKILFFAPKWTQKRLRGNLHEALFFNGREGGIRTHGGSSPHLISSQAPSTTRTPLHAAVRQVALYHRSECMARNFSALYAKGQIASLIVARSR